MAAGFMTHVTNRWTAKNRDQLRNPTLGNRVWATITFFTVDKVTRSIMVIQLQKYLSMTAEINRSISTKSVENKGMCVSNMLPGLYTLCAH